MFAPLLLARRCYTLTEYIQMEGLLTHVATADCLITPPHPALDCGIVTAWWHYQVKGTRPHRGGTRTSNVSGDLRDDYGVQIKPAGG